MGAYMLSMFVFSFVIVYLYFLKERGLIIISMLFMILLNLPLNNPVTKRYVLLSLPNLTVHGPGTHLMILWRV